jgi:hypothetical protein
MFKYLHSDNNLKEDKNTVKKHLKKQDRSKEQQGRKIQCSEKRQRHYAFGFLVGEY